MALILGGAAVFLAWLGQGHPLQPVWALAALPLCLWAAGLGLRHRLPVHLGFLGLLALAAICALAGQTHLGLGVVGLALLAWDSPEVLGFRKIQGEGPGKKVRHGFPWSLLAVGIGLGLASGASRLRLALSFWALVGLVLLAWLILWSWVGESTGPQGGKAKGNRSTSRPRK